MSFSSVAKESLLRKRVRSDDERRILLMSFTATMGTITLRRGMGMCIKYITESLPVARLISKCAQKLYNVEAELSIRETNTRKSGRNAELILFGKDVESILCLSQLLNSDNTEELPDLSLNDNAVTYLKGAFLACGSVTDPNKSYHLEIVCRNEQSAKSCILCGKVIDLSMKYTKRKDSHIAYLKDGEGIAAFLSVIGADDAVLEFEDVRAYRDTRNYANRTRNCDMANITKSNNAAMKQTAKIEYLLKNSAESLPEHLFETASARLSHPFATLSELAEILGIGKSGVNHRLQKLVQLADELQQGEHD